MVESVASTSAVAQAYAIVTAVPDDAAQTVTVKGQYEWKLQKVEGIWKVASVTLLAVCTYHVYSVSSQVAVPHDVVNSIQFTFSSAGSILVPRVVAVYGPVRRLCRETSIVAYYLLF
ncbi:hypothetical protein FS749_014102 [Ceratobasidium sp. UAMH 11750]|nr:hypothetical protein FS749_014102 [Ceratobasidium sp. UAMH 11750]